VRRCSSCGVRHGYFVGPADEEGEGLVRLQDIASTAQDDAIGPVWAHKIRVLRQYG
jgi:hypothetical protein